MSLEAESLIGPELPTQAGLAGRWAPGIVPASSVQGLQTCMAMLCCVGSGGQTQVLTRARKTLQ